MTRPSVIGSVRVPPVRIPSTPHLWLWIMQCPRLTLYSVSVQLTQPNQKRNSPRFAHQPLLACAGQKSSAQLLHERVIPCSSVASSTVRARTSSSSHLCTNIPLAFSLCCPRSQSSQSTKLVPPAILIFLFFAEASRAQSLPATLGVAPARMFRRCAVVPPVLHLFLQR